MNDRKLKIIVITALSIFVILFIGMVFFIAASDMPYLSLNINDEDYKETFIGNKIAEPDRIVYKDESGKYFEFKNGEEEYSKLKALIGNSISTYNENGEVLSDTQINEIHQKSFIEFDYKKISKNYIIQLEENNNRAVIKLADTGGNVVTEKIDNLKKLKKSLDILVNEKTGATLDYKEFISKNVLTSFEYKYIQEFEEIKYNIYQVKINNFEDYEKFSYMCNIAIEEKITEETFKNNIVILTVSVLPKIDVKVNLGNIQYTYSNIKNTNFQYNVHVLIVNKIVNTDCIYNTDLSEIESKVDYDNMKIEHDNSVQNIAKDIFVTDIDSFMKDYKSASTNISKDDASKIAEKGFEEAERICAAADESTQTVDKQKVKPNNFFTRKLEERDEVYSEDVDVYVFTRYDDMQLNGIEVYVDTKLGKIVGGRAFGD